MIAYKVNNKFINNIFLAARESQVSTQPVELYCYDHVYDQHNWAVEPELDFESLLSSHALHLRNKFEKLILLWSGGTDSHTIYNIFKKNQIHIDEIIIRTNKNSIMFPDYHAKWLKENHWDPHTIITDYDGYNPELRMIDLSDEDWVWKNRGDLLRYTVSSCGDGVKFLCEKNYSGKNWSLISGHEKPRLIYRNGNWYHRQLNLALESTMGNDKIEHFFLEPLVAIKQAHLLKNSVKKLIFKNKLPLYNEDSAEAKWTQTNSGYRQLAKACGRHDELTLGVSLNQKLGCIELDKTELNLIGDWKNIKTADQQLLVDLQNNNQVANSYVKGLYNLTSEFGFVNYLRDNGWLRHNNNCVTSLKFIWSKEYNLGA